MDMKNNTEQIVRSDERRDTKSSNRRIGEDGSVIELFEKYEVVEERNNIRRSQKERRS